MKFNNELTIPIYASQNNTKTIQKQINHSIYRSMEPGKVPFASKKRYGRNGSSQLLKQNYVNLRICLKIGNIRNKKTFAKVMCIDPKSFWGSRLTRLTHPNVMVNSLVYFQTFRRVVRFSGTDRVQNANRTEFSSIFAFAILP